MHSINAKLMLTVINNYIKFETEKDKLSVNKKIFHSWVELNWVQLFSKNIFILRRHALDYNH
jgi:hypothetical protein